MTQKEADARESFIRKELDDQTPISHIVNAVCITEIVRGIAGERLPEYGEVLALYDRVKQQVNAMYYNLYPVGERKG